jgi:pyridoxamine 5'-phosphate oxidase family protein
MTTFTEAELAYLATQRLGRLATIGPDGYPQNNPVGFWVDEVLGAIVIGGHGLGASRKFASVRARPQVSFAVDDIVSFDPWRVRGMEIRGDAEALLDQTPPMPGFSPELIRIRPRRIRSWGLDPTRSFYESDARWVAPASGGAPSAPEAAD